LKLANRQAEQLLEQLEHVPQFQSGTMTPENLRTIRDVIVFRLNRNKLATLNQADMSIDYGVKIPQSGAVLSGIYDPDIEWIVSASASSASANSARSQKEIAAAATGTSRVIGINESHAINNANNNVSISSGSFRQRSSGNKRMPWEDVISNSEQIMYSPKIAHTVAPLKAFPLNEEFDSNGFSSPSKNGYPISSSYH
jgi:hypothetical protein